MRSWFSPLHSDPASIIITTLRVTPPFHLRRLDPVTPPKPLSLIRLCQTGALQKWRMERGWDPNNPTRRIVNTGACERIVVLNKRDLVPEWGMGVCSLLLK